MQLNEATLAKARPKLSLITVGRKIHVNPVRLDYSNIICDETTLVSLSAGAVLEASQCRAANLAPVWLTGDTGSVLAENGQNGSKMANQPPRNGGLSGALS
jgi:hypothetical protein